MFTISNEKLKSTLTLLNIIGKNSDGDYSCTLNLGGEQSKTKKYVVDDIALSKFSSIC